MFYNITGLCPHCPHPESSGCGFSIQLWPIWKELVGKSKLTQEHVNNAIETMHRGWLDGCGYAEMYDPDEDPLEMWKEKHLLSKRKLGPKSRHLYGPHSIHISWGEWGPEHITVPGNACGLDISDQGRPYHGGKALLPHNVDHRDQAMLLLVVFTWFADSILLHSKC
jgi:hypothetical protein